MVGVRRRGILGLCLLGACVFDTESAGGSAMLEDTDASTSTSGTTTDATDPTAGYVGSDTSDGSQGGTGGSNASQASSGGADETTTSVDPSEGNPPRADLVFVDGGPVELGVHPLSGPTILTLQLTNQGDAAGSILGGDLPPPPLLWAGGTFPGTDATCQGLVPPSSTCTVTVAVGPGQPGLVSGPVQVRFDDGVGTGTASVIVGLTATGVGVNLIENADAESDPAGEILTGWDAEGSSFHTTGQHNHGEGSLAFFGGGSENPEISQDVVLDAWSESIDSLDLRFAFTGWTRAQSNFWEDDPHGISITFLDGTGVALADESRSGMTHSDWESTSFDALIPATTRRVRIRLTCDRNDLLAGNNNCSAWFDDFSGALAYAPK